MTSGPRVVSADALPQTAVGHRMVSDELLKTQKKAAGALLVVGIIQFISAGLLYAVIGNASKSAAIDPAQLKIVVGIVSAVGLIYIGLFFWARKSPLPAAIVGLVLYITLQLADAVSDPASLGRGIILKIIVIVVLIQAIQAGLKHKQLLRAQSGG